MCIFKKINQGFRVNGRINLDPEKLCMGMYARPSRNDTFTVSALWRLPESIRTTEASLKPGLPFWATGVK